MSETAILPWVIELRGPAVKPPIKLRLDSALIIGRKDVQNTADPDVDLAAYKAEENGVSRQHLKFQIDKDQLMVIDLDSGNGTLLNGVKLDPQTPYPVKNKDILQLGRLPIELGVLVSPSAGSIMHKHSEFQIEDQVHDGDGQLVLVVEDDVEVAKVLALILERGGYKPQVTHDVVSAMRAFNQKRPSAIVLDLMLPDMNGLELCRYVRRSVQRNTLPVIVVSAVSTTANVTKAIEAGADIFLGKPVSARELRHVVSSLISQHESGLSSLRTRHLVGTAPLQSMQPESRRESVVLFVAGHSETPITLTVRQPVTFGRSVEAGSKNYVDLSRFNAIDNGVSRKHMMLHAKEGKFFVEDADSVNGTFLNGNPLKPNELTELNNADEIRLGQMRMYVYFLTDKDDEEVEDIFPERSEDQQDTVEKEP
ncbi:MAG: FHA domain-containing protein [Anaerolineae bacterium]|nr:FHA domain-containing protein [Anaerolineae bacterium]